MTKSIPIGVQARIILNPIRADGTTSVDKDYIVPGTIIEASAVSIAYARNSIPMATVTLAMGRKQVSSFRVAEGHPTARQLVRRIDLMIEANLDGLDGVDDEGNDRSWPPGFFTLFDGFITGVQLQRANNEAGYSLQVMHWMGHLLDSSVLSDRLHSSSPGTFFVSSSGKGILEGTHTVPNKITSDDVADDLWGRVILIALKEIANDDLAKPKILDEISKTELSKDPRFAELSARLPEAPGNKAALKALNRFLVYDPDKLTPQQREEVKAERKRQEDERAAARKKAEAQHKASFEDPQDATPLPPSIEETLPPVQSEDEIRDEKFGDEIREANLKKELPTVPLTIKLPDIANPGNRLNSRINSTAVPALVKQILVRRVQVNDSFWGRLLMLAQQFQFSIIPGVNSAVVAPALLSGTREPLLTIPASEIMIVQGTGTTDRTPRGLVLYSRASRAARGVNTGTNPSLALVPAFLGKYDIRHSLILEALDKTAKETDVEFAALLANAQLAGQGLWVFRLAPQWLETDIVLDSGRKLSIRQNGLSKPQMSHAGGLEKPAVDKAGKEIKDETPSSLSDQEAKNLQFIGDRFAKWMLLDEIFQQRVAVLSGRFRVDIAPGSTIRFDTMGANIKNLPFVGAYTGVLQATVNQVTLTLDAESANAATTLTLSHIRNESEIATKTFSPVRHPVYNQDWAGGSLVPRNNEGVYRSLFKERNDASGATAAAVSVATGGASNREPIINT